jgi:hypothetical protein
MKFRTTGLLLVIFLALATVVVLIQTRPPAAAPNDKSLWVLTLAPDDVQGLTVNDLGKTIALVKNNGVWYIGDAAGQEADGIHVGTVVDSLVNLQATRVLTDTAEALSAYGLEQPATSVVLSLPNNQLQTLTIGSKNPDGSLYYLQKKGDAKVYLVYQSLVSDLKGLVASPPIKPTPTAQSSTTPAPGSVAPATTPTP